MIDTLLVCSTDYSSNPSTAVILRERTQLYLNSSTFIPRIFRKYIYSPNLLPVFKASENKVHTDIHSTVHVQYTNTIIIHRHFMHYIS